MFRAAVSQVIARHRWNVTDLSTKQIPGSAPVYILLLEIVPMQGSGALADLKKDIQVRILAASRPVKKSLIIPGAGEAFAGKKADFEGTLAAKVVITYSPPAGPPK